MKIVDINNGDLVKITDRTSGHEFQIGENVRFVTYDGCYMFEHLDKRDFWWVAPSDFEVIK